jgi:hypothetical protein
MNKMLTFIVKENDRRDRGAGLAIITVGQWLHIPALMV